MNDAENKTSVGRPLAAGQRMHRLQAHVETGHINEPLVSKKIWFAAS